MSHLVTRIRPVTLTCIALLLGSALLTGCGMNTKTTRSKPHYIPESLKSLDKGKLVNISGNIVPDRAILVAVDGVKPIVTTTYLMGATVNVYLKPGFHTFTYRGNERVEHTRTKRTKFKNGSTITHTHTHITDQYVMHKKKIFLKAGNYTWNEIVIRHIRGK